MSLVGGFYRRISLPMKDDVMPFALHLEELRRRLIICIIAIAAGFLISCYFKEQLFAVLMKPMIAALPGGGIHKVRLHRPS